MSRRGPAPEKPWVVATVWPRPDVCLVRLTGELDMSTAPSVRDHLVTQTGGRAARLVLDLTGVELIAAAGISVLITALRNEQGVQGRLHVVVAPDGAVLRTLRLTGVDTVLRLHHDVDGALLDLDPQRAEDEARPG